MSFDLSSDEMMLTAYSSENKDEGDQFNFDADGDYIIKPTDFFKDKPVYEIDS